MPAEIFLQCRDGFLFERLIYGILTEHQERPFMERSGNSALVVFHDSKPKALYFWIFWTSSPKIHARIIKWLTSSTWNHIGCAFTLNRPPDYDQVYYEALMDYDVSGPRPIGDLKRWEKRHPKRRFDMAYIPVDAYAASKALKEAERLQGISGYNFPNLLWIWFSERIGIRVPHDEGKLVCSEFVSRVAYAAGIDLRDEKKRLHDEVTPESARRQVKNILSAYRKSRNVISMG